MKLLKYSAILFTFLFWKAGPVFGQACTTLGQTPPTAFPVCGTTTFHQSTVPICATTDIIVPGCNDGAMYQNKNPFFYKFTCYVAGTLGFVIHPIANNEDYDWQLWDITNRNPNDIFTDPSLIVTGNWAGTYGNTGASASGVNYIQCSSVPGDNKPTFAQMPTLIVGHQYLLMISHFSDGQSGYDLSFGGGTAVINDANPPLMLNAKPDCDGKTITIKLNKKVQCSTLTAAGSEFSISPAVATVVGATTDSCSLAFDFDDLVVTLSSAVPNGTYDLVINRGTDGNTLLDNCDNAIADGQKVSFTYAAPVPIFADSIGQVGCSPDSLKVYFPKKIACSSIAADGSDFQVTGPTTVTVSGAGGNCVNGKTPYVIVRLAAPIYTKGNYVLHLVAGTDGTVVIDECGQETPVQSLPFVTADTVNADFNVNLLYGCLSDTLFCSHNGAHDVNSWKWTINSGPVMTSQLVTAIFPASSNNTIRLTVSNGVCTDTTSKTIVLDNEVRAAFAMDNIICPEDALAVTNNSSGQIDAWKWTYDVLGTSSQKDPPPFLFPTINRESYYTVRLVVFNFALGCADSTRHTLTVLDHCHIDVPTAFTPNNDGRNDFFHPHNALKADNYQFKVYNRWGQLVFQSTNWRDSWDGTIHGVKQAADIYVWMLSYTDRDTHQPVFKKGTVMLIR